MVRRAKERHRGATSGNFSLQECYFWFFKQNILQFGCDYQSYHGWFHAMSGMSSFAIETFLQIMFILFYFTVQLHTLEIPATGTWPWVSLVVLVQSVKMSTILLPLIVSCFPPSLMWIESSKTVWEYYVFSLHVK